MAEISRSLLPGGSLHDYLGMHSLLSHHFQTYQLLTYMFLHGGFVHFLFNMIVLISFGVYLERLWGSWVFLMFYLFCGTGAALFHGMILTYEHMVLRDAVAVVVNATTPSGDHVAEALSTIARLTGFSHPDVLVGNPRLGEMLLRQFVDGIPMVGASGALFGILTAFGLLFPSARLLFFFFIPIRAIYAVILFGAIELGLGLLNAPGDFIAHYAHLGGMLWAVILLTVMYRKPPWKLWQIYEGLLS